MLCVYKMQLYLIMSRVIITSPRKNCWLPCNMAQHSGEAQGWWVGTGVYFSMSRPRVVQALPASSATFSMKQSPITVLRRDILNSIALHLCLS